MWVSLFYDKYAGTHQYQNKLTKNIDIEYLEDSDKYYERFGDQAVEYYNTVFDGNKNIQIPSLDPSMYQVTVYTKGPNESPQEVYAIIAVNSEVLEGTIKKKETIPNRTTLMSLCRAHQRYEAASQKKKVESLKIHEKGRRGKINDTMTSIVNRVMQAVSYNDDVPISDPEEISAELFLYQKCSVKWMLEKENQPETLRYNANDEVQIGNTMVDFKTQNAYHLNEQDHITLHGGGIIDEVGLGKTLQMTTLGVVNPPDDVSFVKDGWLRSRATLVICPTQLCGQWKRELANMISKNFDPKIVTILSKTHFNKITYHDIMTADFVIVSFTFLDNKVFANQWVPSSNYQRSSNFNSGIAMTSIDKVRKRVTDDPIATLLSTDPFMLGIHWHRLVVDEFHEAYANVKYGYIRNILPLFKSTFRWCVTATPFCKLDNLYHIVNYLSNYTCNTYNIFESEKVIDYLADDVFRRNTKNSVKKEHTLPPVNEDIQYLKFSPTERMMYNAYLADGNNDKFSVYLRQLCCHPKLADETKHALSNCKTLEDIEKMMVQHYQKQVDAEQMKVDAVKDKITDIETKIRRIERKQKIAYLKRKKRLPDPLPDELVATDAESEEDEPEPEVPAIPAVPPANPYQAYGYNNGAAEHYAQLLQNADNFVVDDDDIVGDWAYDSDDEEIDVSKLKLKKLMVVRNLEEYKADVGFKLINAEKILKGKQSTCTFYKNVVARLRKTMNTNDDDDEDDDEDVEFDPMSYLSKQNDAGDDDDEDEECVICMGEIPEDDIGVTKCGHMFCYQCIKHMIVENPKCPMCSKPTSSTDIFMLNYQPEKKEEKEETDPTKLGKQELINHVGTKLANLIFYLREHNHHTIIFSQWDDLLRKVGRVLFDNGIRNVFCRGNVFQRDKAIREFNEDDGVKVIMLSSEKAASGTNLTKARQVVFLDPIYGTYKFRKDIEKQAVGRAHRLGQKNEITVVRFIVQDSVEHEIYKQNLEQDAAAKKELEGNKSKTGSSEVASL